MKIRPFVVMLASCLFACRGAGTSTPVPATAPSAAPIPFDLVEPAGFGLPAERLAGVVIPRGDDWEVLVTGGSLARTTESWRLRSMHAGLSTGDPDDRATRWSTPVRSDSLPVARLPLDASGAIGDTIRFLLRGAGKLDPGRHWLSFGLHGERRVPQLGGWVGEARWIYGGRAPIVPAGATTPPP
jgi:hypothetical protein